MVTIKDIAKVAGVTFATVSRALNNESGVSEQTRLKILKIAEDLNYVPNLAARRLTQRRSKCIGMIWPPQQGLFFYHLCNELQIEASRRGFSILSAFTEPEEAIKLLNQHFVDRILFWEGPDWIPSMEFYKSFEQFKGEILILGGGKLDKTHRISIDRKSGMMNAVEHLHGLGHRRIGFLGKESDKLSGFTLGLLAHKLELHGDSIITLPEGSDDVIPDERVIALLDRSNPDRPTAMIVDSQGVFFQFIRLIRGLNLQVPEDLSLIVYDHIPEMDRVLDNPITTVGPNVKQLVKKSLEILTREPSSSEEEPWFDLVIQPELFIRESTRQIR